MTITNKPNWARIRDLMWERSQEDATAPRLAIWKYALGKLGEPVEPMLELIFRTRVLCRQDGRSQDETIQAVREAIAAYCLPVNEITRRVDRAVQWRIPDTVGEVLGGKRW